MRSRVGQPFLAAATFPGRHNQSFRTTAHAPRTIPLHQSRLATKTSGTQFRSLEVPRHPHHQISENRILSHDAFPAQEFDFMLATQGFSRRGFQRKSQGRIVTTEAVLWERLNATSDIATRRQAATGYGTIHRDPRVADGPRGLGPKCGWNLLRG